MSYTYDPIEVEISGNSPLSVDVGQVLLPGQGQANTDAFILVENDFTLRNKATHYVKSEIRLKLRLPLIPIEDNPIIITDLLGGLFVIEQNEDDQIRVGNKITTKGITGKIQSVNIGDTIQLTYKQGIYRAVILQGYLNVI